MAREELQKIWRGGGTGADGIHVLRNSLDEQDRKKHYVGIVDIEHEAGDSTKNEPLRGGAMCASQIPIPEKKGTDKSGMGVRPGRIEVDIDGQRTGPPDRQSSQERPHGADVSASEAKGQPERKEAVDRGGKGHGVAIRGGESVGGNGRTEALREKNAQVGEDEKRRPKHGGADREVIVEMASAGEIFASDMTLLVEASFAETFVSELIVTSEVEAVFNQRSARVRIVTDTIAANPGVEQGKSKNKNEKKDAFETALLNLWLGVQRKFIPHAGALQATERLAAVTRTLSFWR